MRVTMRRGAAAIAAGLTGLAGCTAMQSSTPTAAPSQQPNPKEMTFFVTSANPGRGGDFGGLEGADRHCQTLASAAGAPADRTWRAYLSTQAPTLASPDFVNARDRIGSGPWRNARGVVVAKSVEDLHSPNNNLNKDTAIDERGQRVNDRTMQPNNHDILTGSRPDGTAFPGQRFPDMTCGNWTQGGAGSAMTGHFDRSGPNDKAAWSTSWNSAHPTLGCDLQAMRATGGAGLLYCFAAK